MSSQSRGWFLGCVLILVLLVLGGATLLAAALLLSGHELALPRPGPKVGVVEVFGVLGEEDDVLDQLERFGDDGSIEALVLHIDSPGGAVGHVQRIVTRLAELREDGMPVVAALDDVAASGGYYVATAADSIFALPGTLTGSIGVIMSFPDASALMRKIGIDWQVVKTGPYKDTGSPFRALTPEERAWITEVLEDVYEQFVAAIVAARGLEPAAVRSAGDGRFLSGRLAMEAGLVDRLASLEEAVEVAAGMAGIEGKPVVERKPKPRSALDRMLEERLGQVGPLLGRPGPRLEYRWR